MIERAAIVAAARAWLGTPYRHQASLCGVGCDCLGLVRGVWRAVIGAEPESLPGYAPDWGLKGDGEPLLAAAGRHLVPVQGGMGAGDVLVFRWRPHLPAKHCGIYAGEGRVIHAYQAAGKVAEGAMSHWQARVAGCFAFPGVETR